ncbi:MAG: helix-turn-helix transcriptional regulator [Pseudomonadales bacterium]
MSYVNGRILKSLREARQRKGFSQRELSAKSGVPQSHISKIESGGVDLRVSSLVALARVLDLELELVPKKSIPAVKSIVRSSINTDISEAHRRIQKQLSKFDDAIAKASTLAAFPSLPKELQSINRLTRQIERLQPNIKTLEKIESATKVIEKAFKQNSRLSEAVRKAEEQLRSIRHVAAHSPAPVIATKPAYSLDEVDDE